MTRRTLRLLSFSWLLVVGLGVSAALAADGDKLPGGVSFRLKEAERLLASGERAFSPASVASAQWKTDTALAGVQSAREKMKEIEERFAGQYSPDHPSVVAVRNRIDALEAKARALASGEKEARAAADQAAGDAAAASAKWVALLKPYVTGIGSPAHDPAKYLVPSATQEKAEMDKRLAIYAEAAAALGSYRKADLGNRQTPELGEQAAKLDQALRGFEQSCLQYADLDFTDAERKLGHAEEFMKEQEAKVAAKQPFVWQDADVLVGIRRLIDRAAGLARKDDARRTGLQARLDAVAQRNAKLMEARIADTRMQADRYSGGDAGEIRKMAEQIVREKHPDAALLRTSVTSRDWKEESATEWTDTTQTALRHRTTRSVTVQVAARRAGAASLYTLDVSRDRASGAWGPLYGHIMFTDPILEQNVK